LRKRALGRFLFVVICICYGDNNYPDTNKKIVESLSTFSGRIIIKMATKTVARKEEFTKLWQR